MAQSQLSMVVTETKNNLLTDSTHKEQEQQKQQQQTNETDVAVDKDTIDVLLASEIIPNEDQKSTKKKKKRKKKHKTGAVGGGGGGGGDDHNAVTSADDQQIDLVVLNDVDDNRPHQMIDDDDDDKLLILNQLSNLSFAPLNHDGGGVAVAAAPSSSSSSASGSKSASGKLTATGSSGQKQQQQHQHDYSDLTNQKSVEFIKPLPKTMVQNNFNDVLDQVRHLDGMCAYRRCRTRVIYVGDDCRVCTQRFCFTHSLPEIHGCGEAMRHLERNNFMHPPPRPSCNQSHNERDESRRAQNRLADKLDRMSKDRKKKVVIVKGKNKIVE